MVPVYDKEAYEVANELYHFIIKIICQDLIESLEVIRNENRLLATLHQVNRSDIANEIYHLIFGEVNELLVQNILLASPVYKLGEGRYFLAFER